MSSSSFLWMGELPKFRQCFRLPPGKRFSLFNHWVCVGDLLETWFPYLGRASWAWKFFPTTQTHGKPCHHFPFPSVAHVWFRSFLSNCSQSIMPFSTFPLRCSTFPADHCSTQSTNPCSLLTLPNLIISPQCLFTLFHIYFFPPSSTILPFLYDLLHSHLTK